MILKQTFSRLYGREAEVGTTFDPGPEFARSEFKYQRHPEVLGDMLGGNLFICCCACTEGSKGFREENLMYE